MKWFRFYHDVIDDPKVQRLDPVAFKFWVNLLCLSSRSDERGAVRMTAMEIAFATRVSDEEAEAAIHQLVAAGLIEAIDGGYGMHNWDARQRKSDDVTARVTEHRARLKRDTPTEATLDETLHVTGSETLHETLRETEKPSAREELETERETERVNPPEGPPNGADAPTPKRQRRKPEIPIPPDFALEGKRLQIALAEGLTDTQANHEFRKFCSHAQATDRRMVDWDATWQTWVLKAVGEFRPSSQRAPAPPARASPNGVDDEWRRMRGLLPADGSDVIETKGAVR